MNLYRPGTSVNPPIFPEPGFKKVPVGTGVRPAASLYAMVKSSWAVDSLIALATEPAGPVESTVNIFPVTSSKPNPVILLPAAGLKPMSPVTADVGMFETNEPARIAKLVVDPKFTGVSD